MAEDMVFPGQFDYWYDTPYRRKKMNRIVKKLKIYVDKENSHGNCPWKNCTIICIDLRRNSYCHTNYAFGITKDAYVNRKLSHVTSPSTNKIIAELVAHLLTK